MFKKVLIAMSFIGFAAQVNATNWDVVKMIVNDPKLETAIKKAAKGGHYIESIESMPAARCKGCYAYRIKTYTEGGDYNFTVMTAFDHEAQKVVVGEIQVKKVD